MQTVYSPLDYARFATGKCGYLVKGLPRCREWQAEGSRYCKKHKAIAKREAAQLAALCELAQASQGIWPGIGDYTQVYFIRSAQGHVKIGQAIDVQKRLAGLQTANPEPLTFLASFVAPPIVETQLHVALAEHRLSGEWFKWCAEIEMLLALIAERRLDVIRRYCDTNAPKEAAEVVAMQTVWREATEYLGMPKRRRR